MKIPVYYLDAFTDKLFTGNPAAVCVLPESIPEDTLRAIARENNLPTTAFLIGNGESYNIRWITPEFELDLCGHASLAAGYVIFNYLQPQLHQVSLHPKNGSLLNIYRKQDFITLEFPLKTIEPCEIPNEVIKSLGVTPIEAYQHRDERCIIVLDDEQTVKNLQPDIHPLKELDYWGFVVTAPGNNVDFVSRTFYPEKSIPEDAVTGASHCALMPYWVNRLSKNPLKAYQASLRGGYLECELQKSHVLISGKATLYLEGTIHI
ncbi:MAG TPA: PhzF family phenazine biosynthesis protein [Gammaproteobacteria bacterium]|nr:PhzF family phenazine biosynthesis protein [Gammaproteobacteria bacterium]